MGMYSFYSKKKKIKLMNNFKGLSVSEVKNELQSLENESEKIKKEVEKFEYPCTFLESDIQKDRKAKMAISLTTGVVSVGTFIIGLAISLGNNEIAPEIQKSVMGIGTIGTAFIGEYVFSPIKKLVFGIKSAVRRKKLEDNMDKVVAGTKLIGEMAEEK
ncbi:MAG: hypothetical protein MR423_00635 [Firmicutes bacterium]|nr:hypothetical protein [Bacillota bacterium]MDY3658912.1 hypothetical protein [Eubacteriales bacterium]